MNVDKITKSLILAALVIIAFVIQLTTYGSDLAIIFLWIYTIVNVVLKTTEDSI